MEIKRVGTQPSAKGPSDWFTSTVRIDPLFQAPPHFAIQEKKHGKVVDWMERVTDEQYRK
ncbi:MAG: hypothetical protein WA830_16355 [Candidatus Sulfotelmatobacter sp.]